MALALDTTFGTAGVVDAPPGSLAEAVAIQTDGNIVVTGLSTTAGPQTVRYTTTGTVQTTFTTTGVPSTFTPLDIIIDALDRVLISGTNAGFVTMVRYQPSGLALDSSFGTAGVATGPAGSALAVTIQPDQRIVIAGSDGAGSWLVVRFSADGVQQQIFPTASTGMALDLLIDNNQRILVGGQTTPTSFLLVARYTPSGALDTSFGTGGLVNSPPLGLLSGIALQRDGSILAAGMNTTFVVARYDTTGNIDETYGNGGVATGAAASSSGRIVLENDQRSILVGAPVEATTWQVQRFDTTGVPDAAIEAPSGTAALGASIDLLSRVVVTGSDSSLANFQVARYLTFSPALTPTTVGVAVLGPLVVSGTAENPSVMFVLLDGSIAAGTTTMPGLDTWSTTIPAPTTPGIHTLQVVSIYQARHLDATALTAFFIPAPAPLSIEIPCCRQSCCDRGMELV
jgi:uncharacterized delta-60 repeat protein